LFETLSELLTLLLEFFGFTLVFAFLSLVDGRVPVEGLVVGLVVAFGLLYWPVLGLLVAFWAPPLIDCLEWLLLALLALPMLLFAPP
jgi:hypothetical protein